MESLGVGGYKRGNKAAPVANAFALGYTYQDVLDADHEGIIPHRTTIAPGKSDVWVPQMSSQD